MNRNASGSFSSKLAHAQSTPAGVDGSGMSSAKTPPTTPKRGGKMISVRVQMLDDTITVFQVQAKAIGRLLFDQVCKQLNLLEADYFGLEYQDSTTKYWLDLEKPIQRQLGLSLVDPLLRFCVKFYTPDPAQIEEEYTRYLFCLQLKRDLMEGDLLCNDNTAALIISYIVQAECGDYTSEDYPDHTYLSSHRFVPHQDRELERKIMENHKKHVGQTPAEADLNLLETARRCELYGMKMHLAKDQEGVPLNLAVAHMGIVVFQNSTKINTFSWAKIRKISFKRKRFLIKLHPEGYGYYKDVVEFIFDNRNQCKSFWKKCVENHGFFRCSFVQSVPRQRARVLSRGSSSFRYSGKTQKQMIEYVRENYVRRQTFQRSQSFRHQSSTHSSVVNVGASSISAHPLLPLGENAIAGSGASLSCGSMTLSGSLSPTIPPEGGPPTAPTAQNHQQSQQQQQQQQQTPADVHEPATTCSDITSIASQSPPHDTGQTHLYHSEISRLRLCEKLTNASNATVATNTLDRQAVDAIFAPHRGPDTNSSAYRDIRYDYETGKVFSDIRFPTARTIPSSVSYSSGAASTVVSNAGASSTRLKTVRGNRTSLNDPDIIRDLGKQNRTGDDYAWQRSASCKELGQLQPAVAMERLLKADAAAPAIRRSRETAQFDSFGHCYSCHGGQSAPFSSVCEQTSIESKVYSSSYPGTTPHLSVESDDEATGIVAGSNVYLMDNNTDQEDGSYRKISHDDLSHDSYELLEKEEMAAGLSRRSRSSSVNSDEMFVMENDYESASKHIFWREGSADVEKRLGYVEPRYRNIDFNEFNEICKRGFASRNRDTSLSHGNIRFSEFAVGDKLEKVAAARENVTRTKSDPYMIGSSSHTSNRHKLFGVHQKSFDLAPSECYGGGGGSSDDHKYAASSKSTVDIPYTLRIRNAMNGTAREYTVSADESYNFGPSVGNRRSLNDGAKCAAENDIPFKAHASDYAASQDSGLSLSLGTESVDDIDIDLKNMMLAKNSYEQVITSKKSTKLMLSLSEENNENVPSGEEEAASSKKKAVDGETSNVQSLKNELKPEERGDNKHIIKVKSVEVPKKTHSSGGGRVRKSRSAEACDRKSSFLRTDSGGSRGKKEIIVIDSDDYHSFDDSRSDKRSDGSDSVIIVEYRGNKKKKLSKKASSDSRGSQAESEASSFDAPRIKKKELKKRHSAHAAYFYKDRIPTIEISEDETYKVDTGLASSNSAINLVYGLSTEYSSDERHASGSDLSKTEVINELIEDDVEGFCGLTECGTSQEQCDDLERVGQEESVPVGTAVSTAVTILGNGRFSAVGKTPPMLTRLGLSEGSAMSHLDQKLLPASAARRTKSLDTPIVSLHRLPPITSFSSKDDTVDSEAIVAVLEEMPGKCSSSKTAPTRSEECMVEEQSAEETTSVPELLTTMKPELKPKPTIIRSVSAAVTAFSARKQSLDLRAFTINKSNDAEVLAEVGIVNKERSKSEGYDRNIELSKELSGDRKHSTRQERLDSFKKLKNFSIELWESEEVDGKIKKVEKTNSKEFDDNVFEESVKSASADIPLAGSPKDDEDGRNVVVCETKDVTSSSSTSTAMEHTVSAETIEGEAKCVVESTLLTPVDKKIPLRLELVSSDRMPSTSAQKIIPEKRSFDDKPSTSLSTKPEPFKMAGLESSGSSSVEEGMLPCDCGDDEELAQLPSAAAAHATLDAGLTLDAFANPLASAFNPGFFSLARTLSRISERSTTSEQERTTDLDDDSTKPLSRSLSIDDSILSSDQHPSFSSDPPSGMNLENVFDDDDVAPTVELDEDKLDFNIPPPLLSPTEPVDDDWPSPPCSPESVKTPVIDSKNYSAAAVPTAVQLQVFCGENSPPKIEAEGEEEAGSISEDNKTLQEEDDGSELDDGKMYRKERTRGSIGDDTSAGLTTSDWSSSTGTTVKQAHTGGATTTAPSTASKSEDNSLAGECGLISLSTDTPTTPVVGSSDPSRRSSTDELASVAAMPFEKKYLTLDRKQTSADRKLVFFPPTFDSFDDEYDSPCTESEDTPSSPMPLHLFRQQRLLPQDQSDKQPPPPPRHFQDVATAASSATPGSGPIGGVSVPSGGVGVPSGGGAVIQKWRTKTERNRATKFAMPHYTSSSMSTSVESPTSAERKFAKMVAKAKCYSYYSLARSPPSDGSSSSPDAPETPLTPNTIPRVSKRRRVAAHSSARRRAPQQRLASDEHLRGGDHYTYQHSHHYHSHHHSAGSSVLASAGYKSFQHSRRNRYQGVRTSVDENASKVKNAS